MWRGRSLIAGPPRGIVVIALLAVTGMIEFAPVPLSQSVLKLKPSATIAAATKAKALRAEGHTVYDFTLGEPDFTTPAHICEAATEAMKAGHTHYTQAGGLPELKKAITEISKRDFGFEAEPTQVVISNGAKHSIHNVLTAMLNEGDEVIIPTPFWVSYSALVELAGGVPVLVTTNEEDGFVLTPEQLSSAVTPKTKLLMLNSPSNPTGAVYGPDQLRAVAQTAVEHGLWILSDEIYAKLIYPGAEFQSVAAMGDEIAARTIIVNGVSKAYAMTGWRIGWTISSPEFAKAMEKLQSQETSCPSSVSQYAAITALNGPQECVDEMLAEFATRRTFVLDRLREIPGIDLPAPGGAFYAFFNISEYFGKPLRGGRTVENETDFCTQLLEEVQVGLVTGAAFGAPGYVRLSFASSLENLTEGLERIATFLNA